MVSLSGSNNLSPDLSESNDQRQLGYSPLLNITNNQPQAALSTQAFSAQLVLSTPSVNTNSVFKPAELITAQPLLTGELNFGAVSTTAKPSPSNAALTSYIPTTGGVNQTATRPLQGRALPSGDQRIDTILGGYKWGVKTLTYSFFAGGTYYGDEVNVVPVSEGVKKNVRYILKHVIEPLIDVTFVEVQDSSATKRYGQLRYLASSLGEGYAHANYPVSTDANQGNSNDIAGDVVINSNEDKNDGQSGFQSGMGSYAYETLIHETLHALGLKHPGDYNGDQPGDPPYLPFGQDNNDNTVMSYNTTQTQASTPMPYDVMALHYLYGARAFNTGNTTYTFSSVFGYSDGTRTVGSTTSKTKLTLWDSGGNDTLNFSKLGASAGYYFDLSNGGWLTKTAALNSETYNALSSGSKKSGKIYTVNGPGTSIGPGVTIENAIGSTSNDTLYGNNANNTLVSNGGNDFINGEAGDDTLIGGAGNSTLIGGLGNDVYYIQSLGDVVRSETAPTERDTIRSYINFRMGKNANVHRLGLLTTNNLNGIGNDFDNTIVGNSGNNKLDGQAGDDTLNGGGGSDTLNGGLGDDLFVVDNTGVVVVEKYNQGIDTVNAFVSYILGDNVEHLNLQGASKLRGAGNALNNQLVGNIGSNLLNGQAGSDTLYGENGNDTLLGGIGIDVLYGGYGNDTLLGGDGTDFLLGENGNDVLAGGAGNDILTGGVDNDFFVYGTGVAFKKSAIGIDKITDFSRVAGDRDQILLSRATFKAGTSFANVATDAQAALSSAYITFSAGTRSLFYNQNGSAAGFGTGGQFAEVSNVSSLVTTDFTFIA